MGQNRGKGANRELERIRRELIAGYYRKGLCGGIGITELGELEIRPFFDECKKRFPSELEALRKAVQLNSIWQDRLMNPNFHLVHVVKIHDKPHAFTSSDDTSIYWLEQEWGDEICHAVVSTYIELIEQNSGGRKIVSELWNFEHNRRATLTEATKHIISDRKQGMKEEIDELRKLLALRDEQIEFLKKSTLTDCPGNKEIQELLDVFPQTGSGDIQIREEGILNFEPFKAAFKNTLPRQVANYRAVELYTKWEVKLRDPTWHMFKIVDVDGEPEAVLNTNDNTLDDLND